MNPKIIIIFFIFLFAICISISICLTSTTLQPTPPVQTPVQIPIQTPVQTSVQTSVQTPVQTPVQTSVQTSVQTPVQTPEPAPATSVLEYKPFIAGTQTATPANDWGNGNSIYLDRHNVNCDNKPINELHLFRPAADKIQWQYTCANGGNLGSSIAKSTPGSDWGGGNIDFLDRHDANCGDNNVMTQIHLSRPTPDQIQWQYSCAPNTQSKKLNCRQVTTGANDDGGGNSIYLDRHDIKCNSNEAISRIHLKRTDDHNYQFEYTCCS
jgi:hypothetical protein